MSIIVNGQTIPSGYPALDAREQTTVKQIAEAVLTQAMYDALAVKDPHTRYNILSPTDYAQWLKNGGN